ncbi:aldo/keto reductase [bacterium]|nr:aldo/keto reductase [bacterium]
MEFPHFSPRRLLGRTGFVASRLGIGDLADRSIAKADLVSWLHRLMDAGLNVIDTAPGYESGYSEEVVGAALKGRREGMFLVDKIDLKDQPVAPQVEGSLRALDVEAIDLMVFHGVSSLAEWERLAASGGPFDELDDCIRAGKARFAGISCHDPVALSAAIRSGRCDVVLFPVGAAVDRRYIRECLPLCREHGVGSICFKTFGAGKLLGDTMGYGVPLKERPRGKVGSGGADVVASELPRLTVEACVRYTLTIDPDVALLGLSMPNEQDAALLAAAAFLPMSPDELAATEEAAAIAIQGKGRIHWNPDTTRPH